jgi:hypothetical protein
LSRLTEGQDFLILEPGVYFSLDRPEFVQLRELIEESKALHDHRRPELSINRFQASLWEDLTNLGVAIDQSARWEQTVRGLTDVSSIEDVDLPETLAAPPCGPISSTDTAGCGSSGVITWAASWPTTWAWARRSKRWR